METEVIEDGIYNFVLQKRFSILTYLGGLRTSREKYGFSLLNFKITFANEKDNKKYFYIYHVYSGNFIGAKNDTKNNIDIDNFQITVNDKIIKDNNINENYEWELVKVKEKDNNFIVKNKFGCVLNEIKSLFFCSFNVEGTVFGLVKIYQEKIIMSEEDKKILDEEPIDVFIKYIDLTDPNLIRDNLTQIKKDIQNDELKYCVRSILKNIPWIRKIFILMPNEKVRFFKNYSEINKKIIYIKDKDILGHESSNIHAFQFRLWKLKEFGLSENFISMDDDYFIGKPLEKSDFFYVENKTVFPFIINNHFQVQTLNSVQNQINIFSEKIKNNKRTQTNDEFSYIVYRTFYFLLKYFQFPITIPVFTHNAIPVKAEDLKELFDIINNSTEFRYPTLYSLYRHPQSLQYQSALTIYTFNKYKRKVNKIKYGYIDAAKTIKGNFNFPLFCINTGNNSDYSKLSFMKMKITMEKLFPIPTKYEKFRPKSLANNAFKVMKKLEEENKKLIKKKKKKEEPEKQKFDFEKIYNIYEKLNDELEFIKAEKIEFEKQNNKKIYSEMETCKKELNNVNNEIFYYKKKIIDFIKENEENLEKINNIKNKENKLYLIIYFQIILIIAVVIAFGFYCYKNKNNKNEKYDLVRYDKYEYLT